MCSTMTKTGQENINCVLTDKFITLPMVSNEDAEEREKRELSGRSSAVLSFAVNNGGRFEVFKRKLRAFLEKPGTQFGLLLLLTYVLFVNNIATISRLPDESIVVINSTLIFSFGIFCLEMALNLWTVKTPDVLYIAMEVVGTLSILLEVSWIAESLGLGNSIETETVSKTAIITSRAGRVTRMVRLIRFVRALKFFIMIRRYFARKVKDDGKEPSIAPTSLGNSLNDRISLLAAFLVMMTMMIVALLNPHDVDEMARAFMLTLSILAPDKTRAELQPLIDYIKDFIDKSDGGVLLRKVVTGDHEWDWYESGCCSIEKDLVTLTQTEPFMISMDLDISDRNINIAYLELLLGIAVIIELFLFVALLRRNTSEILITPLERIFTTIKRNASEIVNALETKDPIHPSESTEIDTIEAAINKMSKLVAHISASGNQGDQVLKNYIQDENTNADTKAWLNDFTQYGKTSTAKRHSSATILSSKSGLERSQTIAGSLSKEARRRSVRIAQLISEVDRNAVNSWEFDVTQYSFEELNASICVMFMDLDLASLTEDFDHDSEALITVECLWEFITRVKGYYHDVPYHNFFHCCDVAHATFRFIKLSTKRTDLSSLECFALMIAAVCHDMDHPGFQNSFLVETKHALATVYNDRSVLENRHISCLYSLVTDHPEADVFQFLDNASWKEVRKIIIESILHTDMVKHFGMVSKIEIFYELHSSEIQQENNISTVLFESPEDRMFLFALLLHCADISNPVKPLTISEKWADNVLNEFFRQGDLEREQHLPVSPLCDRTSTSRPGSQINFLEFVIAPLFSHVVRIFPEMRMTMFHLRENRMYWEKLYIDELEQKNASNKGEEMEKSKKRLEGFLLKYKEIFEIKKSSSRNSGIMNLEGK